MHKRKGWRLPVVAVAAMSLAVSILVAGPSTADVTSHYYGQNANASDPHIFKCANPSNPSQTIWCMVTSQDLNQAPFDPSGPGKNYYPMDKTLGFYSVDGVTWTPATTAVTEAKIGRTGFNHLWAPTALWEHGEGAAVPDHYFLYTPDLLNKNDRLSSRIFVSYSTNPVSGFGNSNIPTKTVKWMELNRGTNPPQHYMSDPEVFTNSNTAGDFVADQYMIWADGDNETCGAFGIRKMTSPTSIEPYTSQSQTTLTITDLETGNTIDGNNTGNSWDQGLGKCTKPDGTVVNRPYVEGASLYRKDAFPEFNNLPGNYVLIFAAKPAATPGVCTVPGQPNTANEVIAYATATSVTGPYAYQGIIMCGSSTEWTNQATLIRANGPTSSDKRLMLVHHDGKPAPGQTPRNRQLHAECLMVQGSKILLTARSPEGAVNNGTRGWCMAIDKQIVVLKSVQTGKYVISRDGQALAATSDRVGLWEQFAQVQSGTFTYYTARNPNKIVQVNRNAVGKPVIARATSKGEWEGFTRVAVSGQPLTFRIKDKAGFYWRVDANGKISALTNNPPANDKSYWFTMDFLRS